MKPSRNNQHAAIFNAARMTKDEIRAMGKGKKRGYEINCRTSGASKVADVWLYGDIGTDQWGGDAISAKEVVTDLAAMGPIDELRCHVFSQGGDVFAGLAIHGALAQNKARKIVTVDGLAASIASVICMAGDEITMAANAFMMIHSPWTFVPGANAEALRQIADQLDKVEGQLIDTYARRTGMASSKIQGLMAAETWMTADEAIANGFATSKTEEMAIAASINPKCKFRNTPALLRSAPEGAPQASSRDRHAALRQFLFDSRAGTTTHPVAVQPKADMSPQTTESTPTEPPGVPAEPEDDGDGDPQDKMVAACHDCARSLHDCMAKMTAPNAKAPNAAHRAVADAHAAVSACAGMGARNSATMPHQAKAAGMACRAAATALDDMDADYAKATAKQCGACAEACEAVK